MSRPHLSLRNVFVLPLLLAWIGCAGKPQPTLLAAQQRGPTLSELRAAPGGSDLARATEALARFADSDVARREGYVHGGNEDSFTMGEHWYLPELMRDPRCALEQPSFLQYLVIGGQRRLIGTGYVCDAKVGTPGWFDGQATWHEHGPALCRWDRSATIDAQAFANVLPNELNESTWQEMCEDFRGEALERKVIMLHTWNWIPSPDGPYAHENRAIAFLRAGLPVPTRDVLDAPLGRDALDALSLAHGDAGARLAGGFLITDFGLGDWLRYGGILRRGQERGREAVARMYEAETSNDAASYAAAAAWGAAARREMEGEVLARLLAPRRALVLRFLAELQIHDHHPQPGGTGSGASHSTHEHHAH